MVHPFLSRRGNDFKPGRHGVHVVGSQNAGSGLHSQVGQPAASTWGSVVYGQGRQFIVVHVGGAGPPIQFLSADVVC